MPLCVGFVLGDFEFENIFPCMWALYWGTLSLKNISLYVDPVLEDFEYQNISPECGPCAGDFEFEEVPVCGPRAGDFGILQNFSVCGIDVNTLYWRTLSLRIFPLCVDVDPVLGTLRFYTIFPVCVPCAGDFEILQKFPLYGGLM